MELVFNSPGTVKFLCKIPFTFSPESPVKNNIYSSFHNLYRFLKKVLLQFFRIIYKLLPSIFPLLEVPLASLGSGFPHFAVYRGSSHRFALGLKVLQSLICCVSCQEKKAGKIIRQFTNSYILG